MIYSHFLLWFPGDVILILTPLNFNHHIRSAPSLLCQSVNNLHWLTDKSGIILNFKTIKIYYMRWVVHIGLQHRDMEYIVHTRQLLW